MCQNDREINSFLSMSKQTKILIFLALMMTKTIFLNPVDQTVILAMLIGFNVHYEVLFLTLSTILGLK